MNALIEDPPSGRARHRHRWSAAAAAIVVGLGLGLAGCSSSTDSSTSTTTTPATSAIPFTAAEVTQEGTTHLVSWASPVEGTVTVYAGTDPDAVGREREVGTGSGSGQLVVTGLPDAARWYFELVPEDGESLVVADRSLHLASAPNLRDVGGYRTEDGSWVRMGLLYRSDGLDELTPEDLAALEEVGVRLVCDLRTDYERESAPDVVIPGSEAIQLNVAADSADMTKVITEAIVSGDTATQREILGDGKGAELMVEGGASFVTSESAQAAYRQMYERIADPGSLPALFHCSAGKDRTGWAAASFLAMLGVPEQVVFEDYLASNDYLAASNEETLAKVGALIDPELLDPVLGVRAEYLESSFTTVDSNFGSIDGYLTEGLGLSESTLDQIRQEFLAG